MYAYDALTGKILWQTRLPTSAQGFPITYLARANSTCAMPAGIGGGSWSTLIPPELAPEIRRPNSGNALLVFALPGFSRMSATSCSVAVMIDDRSLTITLASWLRAMRPRPTAGARTVWDGVYTEEQAARGQAGYMQCVRLLSCRGPSRQQHGAEPGRRELFVSVGGHDVGELSNESGS